MSLIKVTSKNFDKEILEHSKSRPVLVDFYAVWCPPCKVMKPIIEDLAQTATEFSVGYCDVEEDFNDEISEKYGVMGIPTFIVFKNGQEVARTSGATSKEKLLGLISS